jgi:methylmalonyl-CoA mutase
MDLEPPKLGPIPLAAGFPTPNRAEWAALAEKVLKGASIDTLVRETLEGVAIQPLYEADPNPSPPLRPAPGWTIRTRIDAADAASANTDILEELNGGAHSALVSIDPTGEAGVAIGSAADLACALDGVVLDTVPVALDAGFLAAKAADWLGAVAKGAPAAPLALHIDPLGAFAEAGASPGPIESHLISAATVGARLVEAYPKASLFLASGRATHEAGGGEALELAMAMASALAYAKALVRAGICARAAFACIVLGVSVDQDVFLSIAKLRAARRLWRRMAAACDAQTPALIEARSSRRMLARADPWTNMIRLSAAAFAAAVGGADAIVLDAFTAPLGPATTFARRQARNTQLVLMEEAHLGRVIDPAAGGGYVEALTDGLALEAWRRLQAIEAAGGAARALEAGLIASKVEACREELRARLQRRETRVLGVTDFPPPADLRAPETASRVARPVHAPSPRLPGPDSRCPPLAPVSLEALS